MWFDTHAHLNDERFAEDIGAVLARMREAGVTRCLCAAEDVQTGRSAQALAQAHDNLWAMAGVHPHNAAKWQSGDADALRALAAQPKLVALGEIGLDYHYDFSPREVQRAVFGRQLELAEELDLPIVLHVRDAYGDVMDALRPRRGRVRGVMHCYSGSWEWAKECLDMGFYLSFSGSVTFKNAPKLWETARNAPLERLMVETDSPYMAPVPHRGQRNEPAFVARVGEKIAALRGIEPEAVAHQTTRNARELFGA